VLDSFENFRNDFFSESLTLFIDIKVISTAEIDALETTGGTISRFDNLLHRG
jgi:hypothetical protein